jgi:hypothetical protein
MLTNVVVVVRNAIVADVDTWNLNQSILTTDILKRYTTTTITSNNNKIFRVSIQEVGAHAMRI